MSDSLYEHYDSELYFVRQLAKGFARQYPAAAARLQLEENRANDPHVERLIEAFALLSARVRQKIDDEFPELTDALLGVLYPHYLAPIPSLALVQFDLNPGRGAPDGLNVARGSMLRTLPVGGLPCRYRTCYPVKLWPVTVTEAKLEPPPFPAGLAGPARAVAALRLRLQTPPELPFAQLSLDRLRFYLHGDAALVSVLYELLFNHTLQVVFRPLDAPAGAPPGSKPSPTLLMSPEEVIHPVGFGADEGLLPYPRQAFPGYRLLTEYFAFPQKFLFADLGGWDRLRARGVGRQVEVIFFVNRTNGRLEEAIEPAMFRLGCTPAANLFEKTLEPIPLTHTRSEYHVVPDAAHRRGMEVYSIDAVHAAGPEGGDREYFPFYSFRHGGDRSNRQTFWYASRRPAVGDNDRGSEVYLRLVDLAFDPLKPADRTMVLRTTCTNRDLPLNLPRRGEEVRLEPEFAAVGTRVRCLRNPTPPLRPPYRRGAHPRLVSHLCLNHLSLEDGEEGREALQQILRLYDFSDPDVEPQQAALTRQVIDGLAGLSSRRVVGRAGGPAAGGFCRGVEVTIDLDETKYVGTSAYLFAAVLERFLGLYVGVNSFSQLVARAGTKNDAEKVELKRWPPRAGDQPLL